jgi:hypothetical protein
VKERAQDIIVTAFVLVAAIISVFIVLSKALALS